MADSERAASEPVVHRPSRFLKFLFDLPGWFYQWGIGWMMGKRILAVTHRGRKSGREHRTILEVALFDKETKESVVASAYGADADWYRNIRNSPALRVQTGRLDYAPVQRFLTPEECREAAARFCDEHPWEAKLINKVLPAIGAAIPAGSDLPPDELLGTLPMVAFRPEA